METKFKNYVDQRWEKIISWRGEAWPTEDPEYLSVADQERYAEYWKNQCKEMTRAQLIDIAETFRDMNDPAYIAATNRLGDIDRAHSAKQQRAEFADAIKSKKAYDKAVKLHKSMLKAGKKSTSPKPRDFWSL